MTEREKKICFSKKDDTVESVDMNTKYLKDHSDLEGFQELSDLALNIRWSWNRKSEAIWQQLDAGLWENTHNPWMILQTVSREKLKSCLADSNFCHTVKQLLKTNQDEANASCWFQQTYTHSPLKTVAYFSMEYMLTEALPIYSGGLGNVAGDQLKAASDLGVPVIGIGLLFQQGYFRQVIDKDGLQQALYPYNDPGQLPITPLRKANGEWLRLEVPFPGWSLWIRTWQVQVGRVKLYLLDSNDPANYPPNRGITSELYGGGSETRLKQELILGICGWRLLEALGIEPEFCHLNEGHAAFAVLERAYSFMRKNNVSFKESLAITRAGNLFTTHTAVPAGFDRFSPELMEQYLGYFATDRLKISFKELMALGRADPNDLGEPFNMAYLAIRGSGAINGVSQLHGQVSRKIFANLFPHWPEEEVPVAAVTNGVHMPSWESEAADELWCGACGIERWLGEVGNLESEINALSAVKLWMMRNKARAHLVDFTRRRLEKQLGALGVPQDELALTKNRFDANVLTLGFARRFATYKRPNILLHDPERLKRILKNPQRPVQLIIAGKAHPADRPGQQLIQQWVHFIRTYDVRSHICFVTDYDMVVTKHLAEGVDVWINTPRRTWEACGTSGMKVLVNGGINLSELDGWWVEAFSPELGWALGDASEHGDDPNWDAREAHALYELLENEVIPTFYERDKEGIPQRWISKMRASMAKLTPHYSANRSVREYTEKYYIPGTLRYQKRVADQAVFGKNMVEQLNQLSTKWQNLRFSKMTIEATPKEYTFEVQVYLDGLAPELVKVELYIDPRTSEVAGPLSMQRIKSLEVDPFTHVYRATVPANYPSQYYTPRIISGVEGASTPLEAREILWQK